MYVKRRITFQLMLADTWPELGVVFAWTVSVIVFYELGQSTVLVVPVLPVTLMGIAVSLFIGFKSTSAYSRWGEARQGIGAVVGYSRVWANQVENFVYGNSEQPPREVREELIHRQIGFVYAVAYQLRRTSRLRVVSGRRIFASRREVDKTSVLFSEPEVYGRFIDPKEYVASRLMSNPASFLLRRQGMRLRKLAQEGFLDSIRQCAMMALLSELELANGKCQRIKNTPFPRQIANFGTVFTWIFVLLLPLALLDVFEREAVQHNLSTIMTHRYMYTLLPFALLVSWVFLTMEKISDSTEDPFESGVHDVPVSALCRSIEIDLGQALGQEDLPPSLEPVDDILY